jgi:UDP-N-acetylmuramoylalanine--D-glutamate ligase
VAVLLNITPDHLDRYDGFAGYAASKARLFGMQALGHLALVDMKAEMEEDALRDAPEGQTFAFIDSVDLPGDQADWPSLAGPHNRANAQAAVATVRALGLDEAIIEQGLKSFAGCRTGWSGWARRMASPSSTIPRRPIRPRPRPLAARRSRGIGESTGSWAACPRVWIWTIARAVLPMSRRPIRLVMRGRCSPTFLPPHARRARRNDGAGDPRRHCRRRAGRCRAAVPACASFDQFRDFEARGDTFRQLVEVLTHPASGEG